MLAPAERRGAAADFLRRDILDMCRDVPDMAARIDDRAEPVAVELVLDRPLQGRAGSDGFFRHNIDIREIEVQPDRRAADRRRGERAHLGMLVGEHDEAVADFELGMADPAAGSVEFHAELGAEHLLVEINRRRAAAHNQIGGQARITIRDRFYRGHRRLHLSLRDAGPDSALKAMAETGALLVPRGRRSVAAPNGSIADNARLHTLTL